MIDPRPIFGVLVLAVACGRGSSTVESDDHATVVNRHAEHETAPATPSSLTVTPSKPFVAGAPTAVQLELRDGSGKRIVDLDTVHEKLLHLIVVSEDLGYFVHEHPVHRADGLLDHTLRLPAAGDYTVYADFTPTGGGNTVASTTISVPGTAPARAELVPAKLPAEATQGPFTVALKSNGVLAAGGDTVLEFEIRDAAGTVTDLRDYLRAKGHCVIISADRSRYLHSHPLAAASGAVRFHTVFPARGIYKLWAEFRPRGEPLLVSFTVDVAAKGSASMSMEDHSQHVH